MKALRIGLALLAALLGTLALGALGLPAGPDLFLLPVAEAARAGAPIPAMLVGLLAGLLQDGFSTPERLLGLHAFTKVLIGYLLATLGVRTIVEKPAAVGALLAGAVLLETGAILLLVWVLRGAAIFPDPTQTAVRVLTTGIAGGIAYALSLVPWRARREARRRKRLTL